MNRQIAEVLKARLQYLADEGYITKLSGLVRAAKIPVPAVDANGEPTTAVITLPIPFEVSKEATVQDAVMNPDSSERSVIYFEAFQGRPLKLTNTFSMYQANLRLICWFNQTRFVEQDATALVLQTMIFRELERNNDNPFPDIIQELEVTATGFPPADERLFSAYSYDQLKAQYLAYPYDCFAIDLSIKFIISYGCFNALSLADPTDCC